MVYIPDSDIATMAGYQSYNRLSYRIIEDNRKKLKSLYHSAAMVREKHFCGLSGMGLPLDDEFTALPIFLNIQLTRELVPFTNDSEFQQRPEFEKGGGVHARD